MDNPSQPPRLTPQQIEQVTADIAAHGQASQPPPVQEEPGALTPAKLEVLMQRALATPEVREACFFRRPPGAKDEGEHDLTPLCNIVVQATKAGGPEAFTITVMYAAWALATLARLQAEQGGAQ